MKILAIEASSEQASVALLIDGAISSRRIDGATKHSQTVLRDVRDLLAEAGLPIGALDAVAFGAGPGAFTGLRLACGVAQGLALGADLGIAVVGSLDAIALQARAPRVLVATDARMGELYYAAFEGDQADSLQALGPVRCALPEALEIPPGPWLGAGSAFRVWPDVLRARGYSWDSHPLRKVWWRELLPEAVEAEQLWFQRESLPQPRLTPITARERHR